MPKTQNDTHTKLVTAALKLAASHDWKQITLEQAAKAAKVPAAQAVKLFPTANDLLTAIVARIDGETAASVGKPLTQGTAHDRLFEVMMARFDVLQKHRPAIRRIIAATKHDPSLACILLPAHKEAMRKMLALSALKEEGIKEALAIAGLLAIYAASLYSWERDDTKDMAQTMAVLDRNLRRADKLATLLFRAF
jgi:AcrR family transcriptional regulator